jgi:hypothetical protein
MPANSSLDPARSPRAGAAARRATACRGSARAPSWRPSHQDGGHGGARSLAGITPRGTNAARASMAFDRQSGCRRGAGGRGGAGATRARTAIRPRRRDRSRSGARSCPVSNRSTIIISSCDGAQIAELAAAVPDLRQTADAAKPAFLLGALRPNRPRPMAQGQLPHSDRRGAR